MIGGAFVVIDGPSFILTKWYVNRLSMPNISPTSRMFYIN